MPIVLRPAHTNHVSRSDLMQERTHEGRSSRLLPIIHEYSRECLAIRVGRRLTSEDALERLTELFTQRGASACLPADASVRTDNGSEFTAKAVREWLDRLSVRTLFIEPGSPWENGYLEPFSGKLRDELPNVEMFGTLVEAQVLLER